MKVTTTNTNAIVSMYDKIITTYGITMNTIVVVSTILIALIVLSTLLATLIYISPIISQHICLTC